MLTDHGRQFISSQFKLFTQKHNIKHLFTAPYNPRCNGLVERANETIGEVIRLKRGSTIEELQDAIHVRLNDTWHSSTGAIPSLAINQPLQIISSKK